ncbi:HlyC/CorC family transporter [Francisella salina]|uniref:Hemolysin-related protein containing CBS domains n=1 Tax=Francisella salina TaxID=573569 RepID=A0ABN3ZNG8_FRAST|nr:CNNM domain-containing protein [Francisella salina]AEI36467.1 Hemolysin-related protein containing CBS domains [Francisella salina]
MSTYTVIIILFILIGISAFFSSSETAMMALNKYKLKHLAKKNHRAAKRSLSLVRNPERLLVAILIGNTFANIFAGTVISSYSEDHFGDIGLLIATIIVTVLVLVFGEIIPKSFAAVYPQRLAFPFSLPLKIIMVLLYPAVVFLSMVSKVTLKLFGIKIEPVNNESLDKEEIQTVVNESNAKLGAKNKNMLIGVLELDKVLVQEVMTHFNKIEYIDLSNSVDKILARIAKMKSLNIILCENGVNNVIGVIKLKEITNLLISTKRSQITKASLRKIAHQAYFIPETVSLQTQLVNFQYKSKRFAIVVDEYGDVCGTVTIEDIMEEIVGEFSDRFDMNNNIRKLEENSYLIGGSATLREINRHIGIEFESEDAKTLSGLIIEEIENLPQGPCCIKYNNILLEITNIRDNKIVSIKLTTTLEI